MSLRHREKGMMHIPSRPSASASGINQKAALELEDLEYDTVEVFMTSCCKVEERSSSESHG